MHAVQFMIKR